MKNTTILTAIALLAASCGVQRQTVAILGDSYSTFEGYVPDGYAIWYDHNPKEENDVCDVSQTWWYGLFDGTRYTLLSNNSYSGATVCNTGYDGADYSDRSFINRVPLLLSDPDKIPDILLIFGGTNDSWADSPIGELQYEAWEEKDLYSALPAYCYMLSYIHTNAPRTRVINIINSELKPEITDGIKAAAEHFGMEYLQLEDIEKGWGHPTIRGMKQIQASVESKIKKN